MSDGNVQLQKGLGAAIQAATGPAILCINFTKPDGTAVGSPIRIEVPRVLSKRLAKMCLAEMAKLTKATLDKVVADLGW